MANDANKVVYEAIVYKKGEGFMSAWKERYLILYIDKRLSYFVVDGLEYKGAILVDNITPSHVQQSSKISKSDGAKYGFYIQTANRKWEFAVKSSAQREEWLTKIRQTIEGKAALTPLNKSLSHDLSPRNLGYRPKKGAMHNRNASKSAITKQFKKRRRAEPKTTLDIVSPYVESRQYTHKQYRNTNAQKVKLRRHHSHNEPPPPARPRVKPKNSIYSNFMVHQYDTKSKISHLFGGYIRGSLDCKFPLVLQNICQQYASYILIGGLQQFPESVLLRDHALKCSMLSVLCKGMNQCIINKIELIYRGTRDGMTAKSFHSHCDGHAKTLTVLYSNYGHLFGAYTNVPWSTDCKYHRDDNAFLFVLKTSKHRSYCRVPQIFHLKKGEEANAVLHYKNYGPVFGHGHDLAVFSLTDNVDTQSCCWSYSFSSVQLIGAWMYCQVTECEVFQIYTDRD